VRQAAGRGQALLLRLRRRDGPRGQVLLRLWREDGLTPELSVNGGALRDVSPLQRTPDFVIMDGSKSRS
jgi:hypothetical protein